ncbi:MAG: electron transfer flavoprotein beta subunit/FixA family protein [Chloroflexi bacterium]|nr:electron transfer flavoprotein beta subunit/FixA family protein [Chloroflexota bacterium]
MNIVVCIKQVPDTASKIVVRDGQIDESGLTWILNPYDEYAVEEALRIKEKRGGKVTLVSLGPSRVLDTIKSTLALGADEAFHLNDPAFEQGDPYTTALVLVAALRKIPYDLIWCGWKGVDGDYGLTGIYLADMLDLPHVSFVVKQEIAADGKSAVVEKEIEGGREQVEVSLPAVFTAQKGLNEPRYASLKGIMAVKRKTILEWSLKDLDLTPDQVGSIGALTEVVNISSPQARQEGRILTGSPPEVAAELVRLLHEEAKVI